MIYTDTSIFGSEAPGVTQAGPSPGITTPVPVPDGGFDQATEYPLYVHEARRSLPGHPIPVSRGYAAQGILRVTPYDEYPDQIFMNCLGQMFCRIRAGYGWTPWWQMAGKPEPGGVGTSLMVPSTSAIPSNPGDTLPGALLTPKQPGTWLVRGSAGAKGTNLFMRIK